MKTNHLKNPDAGNRLAVHRKKGTGSFLFPAVSVVVFMIVAVILFVSVRYGVQNGDEAFFISEAHRLVNGEHLIVNIWSPSQFAAIFNYLPVKLFMTLTGGTTGIVLAMRYVYVAVKLLFAVFLFCALYRYRWWGLLATVIFTAFHPLGFYTINYYTVSILAATAAGVLLFILPHRTCFCRVLAGFLFACCVLVEPATASIYFGYTLIICLACLRKKAGKKEKPPADSLLSFQSWLLITAGAAIAACGFLVIVLRGVDPVELWDRLSIFPAVMALNSLGETNNIISKILLYFQNTGYLGNIAAILFLLFLFFLHIRKKKINRRPLFAAACLIFICMTLQMFFQGGITRSAVYMTDFKPVPLCFLGLASFLLSKEKDKRLFALYAYGITVSLGVCILSKIALGTGSVISAPACVLLFRQALTELQADTKTIAERSGEKKDRNALFRGVFAATLGILILSESCYCFYIRLFQTPESMCYVQSDKERVPMVSMDRGPLKGLYSMPDIKILYDAVLEDMDLLMQEPPNTLFSMGYCAWMNLYTNLPYGTSSLFAFADKTSQAMLLSYWDAHPEIKPDAVYIPFFDGDDYNFEPETAAEKLKFIQANCDCTVQTGKFGYILRITAWNEPLC